MRGRTFALRSATEAGKPKQFGEATKVELRVEREKLVFTAGCNTMSGPVDLGDGRITFVGDGLVSTLGKCEGDLDRDERWLFEFMKGNPSWQLAETRLTISGPDATLRFSG